MFNCYLTVKCPKPTPRPHFGTFPEGVDHCSRGRTPPSIFTLHSSHSIYDSTMLVWRGRATSRFHRLLSRQKVTWSIQVYSCVKAIRVVMTKSSCDLDISSFRDIFERLWLKKRHKLTHSSQPEIHQIWHDSTCRNISIDSYSATTSGFRYKADIARRIIWCSCPS